MLGYVPPVLRKPHVGLAADGACIAYRHSIEGLTRDRSVVYASYE